MHQQSQQVERRPTPMKRRSDDGLWKAVKGILARNVAEITCFVIGGLCVALPIVNGVDWVPAAVSAFGGGLVMLGAMGVSDR